MKKCFKCGCIKPLEEFYKHSQMADGHLNKCKDCNKKDVKKDYERKIVNPEFLESERKRGRQKFHRLYAGKGKANIKANSNWVNKFPEKRPASLAASSKIKAPKGIERHHWSYNEVHWLDVIQLTIKHHAKAHRFLVYDQEQMMYRRIDTMELLDTKQRHEDYIKWCIENKED